MSKIGKKPIIVPAGVTVKLEAGQIRVKGPKGELTHPASPLIEAKIQDNQISFKRRGDSPRERSLHGLMRALLNNMVRGVTQGFEKRLEIIGVGYRAQATGKKITLALGFSHPVDYQAPEGVEIKMDAENKNIIIVSGIDRQKVGQVSAQLRAFRPPEPYKGKGIRYTTEYVPRKAGKAAAVASGE